MADLETCAGCDTPLTEGVPDVFCPACAFRRALALSNASSLLVDSLPNAEIGLASKTQSGKDYIAMPLVAPSPGDVISDYRLLERIGGNMGIVFKAQHETLGKTVALKLLPADALCNDDLRRRFQREMRAMGKLNHENLISASDARSIDHWHLVAMEWIDGRDLQQIVRADGPLPIDLACEVIRQVALALDYVHQNGLIHRDVKPSNLMLTPQGTIKLIDLGLALPLSDETAQLTRTGHVLGSMPFCAPEQIRDPSKVDSRADIYSLGCTLFYLLTAKAPFAGERQSFHEVIEAHRSQPFPTILDVRLDAPPTLDRLIHRMTAKDPDARFPSALEVAKALEPFARGANLCRLLVPVPPHRTLFASPDMPKSSPRRNAVPFRVNWIATALALLALVAVGAVVFRGNAPVHDPVVVLMDTTAAGGVYDEETRARGGTNAEELKNVLQEILPNTLYQESISATWGGDAQVAAMHPSLVVIHRSSFFHTYNAALKFTLPPPPTNSVDEAAKAVESARWQFLYDIGDERLVNFLGFVGSIEPKTQFLVYSRGTDVRWRDEEFRVKWVFRLQARYPKLKGRVHCMVIPGKNEGTFKNPITADQMRKRVAELLELEARAR